MCKYVYVCAAVGELVSVCVCVNLRYNAHIICLITENLLRQLRQIYLMAIQANICLQIDSSKYKATKAII